jgi:spermidine synthase
LDEASVVTGRFRFARLVLAASMFVMGAAGMVYEYALSVLGNNLMGSSHEQIFVIIGLMMFAMGVGASVQRRITGSILDKFLWVELALGLIGGSSCMLVFTAYGFTPAYEVVLYGVALVIGLLVGFEVPMLIRINEDYSNTLRSNLGEILSMDYVGSLLGALLFAFVLLSRVPLAQISLAMGLVSTGIAAFGLVYFWPLVKRPRAIGAACVVCAGVLGAGLAASESWVSSVEQRTYEDPIVYRHTSVYQHVAMTRRGDRTRLYINGHLQFSSTDEAVYHELLVHPAMLAAGRAERVLVLGGGDGLPVREVLKWPGVREVVLVDIDPAMTRLAAEHPAMIELNRGALHDARVSVLEAGGLSPGEPMTVERPSRLVAEFWSDEAFPVADVRVLHLDADLFLRELGEGETFDVVICDFPDPREVALAKLYSVGFYRHLRARLAPGGFVAVQSSSPWHAPEVFRSIGLTLETAGFEILPYHHNVPSFGEWGWHLAWADRGVRASDVMAGLARADGAGVEMEYVTPGVLAGAFSFGEGWF